MDVVYTRRAVFTALRPFFPDMDLLTAMMIWQEKYANKPTHAFTLFLSECCRITEQKHSRLLLLKAIFGALEMPQQHLLPDPLNHETNQFDSLVGHPQLPEADNVVFVGLINALLSHLGNDLDLKVTSYLIAHIGANLALNTQQMFALKAWADKSILTLNAAFDNKQKQVIIHIMYIAICEYIGPVQADQLLALAVKAAEPLAKAHHVDLHDYL